jgi:23S rRNA (guanosine2251-2'-O)-methyltransferase
VKQIEIVLIVHNVRSALNVGSLLRTADGLGVAQVYLTGYTPYPESPNDVRLPHIRLRASKQIHKSALGAENSVKWSHREDIEPLITELSKKGYLIAALEQAKGAILLPEFRTAKDAALIVGSEVGGLDEALLKQADVCLEIPMLGAKESLNVAVAGGMGLYHLRWQA